MVEDRHAGVDHATQRDGDGSINFIRMIRMDHHPGREPRAGEPAEQFIRHALRQHDRQSRVNAQSLEVRNFGKALGQRGESFIHQRQGITAAKDHFVNRLVRGNVVDRWLPRRQPFRRRFVRKVAPKTVAAMHRARRRW